jgi:hypothetical protein
MHSTAKVHTPQAGLGHPRFVRVCFDSPAPVLLLLRLIRSADPMSGDHAALRTGEFKDGQSYCLVDARIDKELRCATIFQTSPRRRLILGGVYLARSLETGSGLAYLEFLRNPKLEAGVGTPTASPRATDDGDQESIDAALSILLLTDGVVLRSATLQDLTHLTVEQNYVRLHLANGENALVRGPLQKYEEVLPNDFVRASRRVIINVRHVQRLRRVSRDLGVVYFAGGEQNVRLGRKASIVVRTALLTRSRLPVHRSPRKSPKQEMPA